MSEELMTGDDLLGLCEVFFYRKWVIEKNENQSYKKLSVFICNRFNLSQLEDWVRLNQLEGSGIVEALENVIQATQLLQVNKKTLEDVDAICEVCSSLNTLQVRLV